VAGDQQRKGTVSLIGSVFEQRDHLMALERRRQQIAASHAPAVAAPVAAPIASAVQAATYAPATPVKGVEPDVAKRRKGKDGKPGRDLKGRDLETDPLTDAHEVAQAGDGEHSGKAYQDMGAVAGPGHGLEPGHLKADSFERPYIEAGHAAESPQAELPRQSPITHARQGYVQPIEPPGALVVGYVPAHFSQSLSMGSPSDR
jgi:hypothetical protein